MSINRDEQPGSRARARKVSASQPSSAAPPPAPAESSQAPSFEAGLAHLGDLVAQLEGGGLGLSESIAAYEQGVSLLRQLHATLETAEQKVHLLTGVAADGTPALEPWPSADAESRTAPGAGLSAAARGATNRAKRLPGMDDASGAV